MKIISKSKLLFLLLISLILISCEDTNQLSQNKQKNGGDPVGFVPINLELTATLTIYKSNAFNSNLNSFITTTGCDAAFYDGNGYSVNAGIVTLNGDTIRRYSEPTGQQNPDSMYAYGYQPYAGLNFNGSTYSWVVYGSSFFSNFSQSLNSPDHETNITSPTNGSNISKSSNLTITWGTSTNACDTVKILITGNGKAINKYVADNGSYTITSTELSIFNVNEEISIHVAAGNYYFSAVGSKYALVTIFSIHQIYCTIVQ